MQTRTRSLVRTKKLVLCALFVALTAVCAQLQVPMWPVPITLQVLPVLLCAALMDRRYAGLMTVVYLLMGLIGLPVFTGMGAGPGKLFGTTGGYIIGFVFCAVLAAWLMEKLGRAWWQQAIAMAAGVLVCYVFGTAWFMALSGRGLVESLMLCVVPFLPGDAVKIVLAVGLSLALEKPLKRALR